MVLALCLLSILWLWTKVRQKTSSISHLIQSVCGTANFYCLIDDVSNSLSMTFTESSSIQANKTVKTVTKQRTERGWVEGL